MLNFLLTCRFISTEAAAMFVRYQLPMVEVVLVLVLVLVLVVDKTSQTISGDFVPSLNVTVNQWNGESLQNQICFEILFGGDDLILQNFTFRLPC